MPLEVLRPAAAPPRLSTLEQRASMIAEQHPDELLVVHFDAAMAALEPARFVEQTLVGTMGAVWVVIGENFRFGHGAVGDAALLVSLGEQHGFGVTAVPLQRVDGERVSSSWIRELVSQGEVDHAARLLGRDPWLEGIVERGDARGRALGVPTANLAVDGSSVRPARGVYAGFAVLPDGGPRMPAAISVGWNPTFGEGRPISVEAHLLDYTGDLYDQTAAPGVPALPAARAEVRLGRGADRADAAGHRADARAHEHVGTSVELLALGRVARLLPSIRQEPLQLRCQLVARRQVSEGLLTRVLRFSRSRT